MLAWLKNFFRRKKYKTGSRLSQFVARDVRRDAHIIDASEVAAGMVVACIRTWNVLHVSKGLAPKPDFSEPRRLSIDALWMWTGESWGGPVPED